jgi:peptide/nickel transport system permease protein
MDSPSTNQLMIGQPGRMRRRLIWRSLKQSRLALIGLFLLIVMVTLSILAPVLAPYNPAKSDIRNRLKPPSWSLEPGSHFLGTDNVGRDILSRVLYGGRVSIFVGIAAVTLGGILGTVLGVTAGYFRGTSEGIIMRLVDIQLAFPSILFAVAIMAVLGASVLNVVVVLSLTSWATYCRVARSQTLSLRENEFIHAARSIGTRDRVIILRHILPNALSPLIVIASFGVAMAIINEAALSFLGVGVPTAIPTWGGMLGEGREYLRIAWWFSTFPGIALVLTVFGVNVLGDWIRDYLDPRLRTLI